MTSTAHSSPSQWTEKFFFAIGENDFLTYTNVNDISPLVNIAFMMMMKQALKITFLFSLAKYKGRKKEFPSIFPAVILKIENVKLISAFLHIWNLIISFDKKNVKRRGKLKIRLRSRCSKKDFLVGKSSHLHSFTFHSKSQTNCSWIIKFCVRLRPQSWERMGNDNLCTQNPALLTSQFSIRSDVVNLCWSL